jgi:hypothetical protein
MTVAVAKFTNAVRGPWTTTIILQGYCTSYWDMSITCFPAALYLSYIPPFLILSPQLPKLWLPLLLLLLFFPYISTFQMMPTVHSKVIVRLSGTPSTVHNLVHFKCHLHIWKHVSGWLLPWIYKIILHHFRVLFIWLKRIATYIITMNPSTAASLWKFFPSFLSYSLSAVHPKNP